ncbi:ATP-binding protein [Caenimonas aquaedulcis]|uniref:histidine kinase n=1 Tax=Caenimonas aquaedulcis TaxID=2793270 RepID=A0A931H6L8_9BURK|nr:ATP-binding protein [Caenimonas aquaedulcis]MBG9389412.1 sensor histidine kinase N-terminal domain-containing protein [Caenimonas aquaedulcis]
MRFHAEPIARQHARFNVFPEGRLCSLRRAMLLWLVPLFLVVGAASAAFSYFSYCRMVGEFMDDQMQQLGQSIAAQGEHMVPPAQSAERIRDWGAYVVQVWTPDGRLQATSWAPLAAPLQAETGFHDVTASDARWRLYTSPPGGPGKRQVQIFQSEAFRDTLAAERAASALAPVLILLPLSILVLWLLSGAMSRAVQDIGREAQQQDLNSPQGLSTDRVPAELRPMVVSFNMLLSRLRESFAMKRRFVQDAAHELRTPLTAVALQLENVRRDMPDGACQQSFAQLEAGVQRAQRLVDQLLKLSRQEAPVVDADTTLDLQAQLTESIGALIALADQRGIDLGLVADENARPVTLKCSASDLRSVVDNLIENALRYTPPGGVVDVRLVTNEATPAIEVIDTGPGIPEDMLPRVFDRFFRVPGSTVNGSGLGLAIAQAAAERCGLRIVLRNRTDRSGLIARVEAAR